MSSRHVTFKGTPLALAGEWPVIGVAAPAFTVLANDLSPVTQTVLPGKVTVMLSVPSLDTPVCDTEVRRFNQEAAALGPHVQILCISADLPFAQARWCGAAGIKAVRTLSDHREVSFGRAYGVLIPDWRLLARALFVTDTAGVLRYAQLVPEIVQEPDYAAALAAVKQLA
ncbi:MAG: thiol peroxidase [bacterium]|nr:thiol peroxidase [bacterium]